MLFVRIKYPFLNNNRRSSTIRFVHMKSRYDILDIIKHIN